MNLKLRNVAIVLTCVLALALVVTPAAWGQTVVTGGITGVVSDSTGARVTGATVALTSSETGTEYRTVTDSSGSYSISLIRPGHYTVTVEKEHFARVTQKLDIGIGQVFAGNYTLKVGSATETVEVTATAPLLQTENANIATTFDANQLEKLPNPGNDLTAVAQTAPGVLMNTANGGGYGNFNAFGLPATSNLFTVNGNDEMDPYLNLNNSGATNLLLGTNELQEVAVVSNGYTGQYGRQAGAQVDYVTKSGTNDWHGNAIYWWNGAAMNANDWFNNQSSTPRPFVNNNQWAASFGGPIKKNKAFFFVDTEGLRYILATSSPVVVPTTSFATAVVAGLPANGAPLSQPFYQKIFNLYGGAPGVGRAVPVGNAFDATGNLGCGDLNVVFDNPAFGNTLIPNLAAFGGSGHNDTLAATNSGGGQPCARVFHTTVGQLSHEWILAGKFDYNFNDKNRVAIRYREDHGVQPTYTDPINPVFNATSVQPAYEGQINYSSSFTPTIFNQMILSGAWYSAIFGNESTAAQSTFPGAMYDFDTNGWANIGGVNNSFPQGRNVTQYQLTDDLSWTKGNHALKFGGNYRRNDITDESNLVRTVPRLRIFSTTDFVTGLLDQISQRFPKTNSDRAAIYSVGFYVQDEWRATSQLKLTMALRVDRNSNEVCQSNCIARFTAPFNVLNHDAINQPLNAIFANNLHSAFPAIEAAVFQPRMGFAWQPKFAPNTVVRGGFGVFSDLYPADLIDNFMHNAPQLDTFTTSTALPLPLSPAEPLNAYAAEPIYQQKFQAALAGGLTRAQYCASLPAGLACRVPDMNDVAGGVKNPKFVQYNLEIQHTFGGKTVLSVNYVGNRGYDLFTTDPFANSFGFGSLPAAATDRRVANVSTLSNNGISSYNGLTVSAVHRFTKGFSGRLNYTFSHSLDDVSNGGLAPYSLNDSLLGQLNPAGLRQNNYSNSDYDIRHLVSANYVWDMPFKASSPALKQMVEGWTVSGTVYHRTGLPFSITDGLMPGSFGNSSNTLFLVTPTAPVASTCANPLVPCFNPADFPAAGSETAFGTTRRNSFRGPGYTGSDLSVAKKFRLTERTAFTGGVNFYNVFNHPNFANPTSDISSGQFGQILSTVVPPTSPYGSFVGSAVSGRLIQLTAKVSF
jgi:hypothetical protein